MKQQCHISMIYFSWLLYVGGLVFLAALSMWVAALVWLILVPVFQWLYIRKFPSLSALLGYGPITDQPAPPATPAPPTTIRLYTALGCPFCPLMEQRIESLRQGLGFSVEKIDVTLRPDILSAKGIRTVPVIEVGDQLLAGLVSTESLAAALRRHAEAGPHA